MDNVNANIKDEEGTLPAQQWLQGALYDAVVNVIVIVIVDIIIVCVITISARRSDLRQDAHRQDDRLEYRGVRYHRKCQSQDPSQGANPAQSATIDSCRQPT